MPKEFEKPFQAENSLFPGFNDFASGNPASSAFGTGDSVFNLFKDKDSSPPGFKNGQFNFNNKDFLKPDNSLAGVSGGSDSGSHDFIQNGSSPPPRPPPPTSHARTGYPTSPTTRFPSKQYPYTASPFPENDKNANRNTRPPPPSPRQKNFPSYPPYKGSSGPSHPSSQPLGYSSPTGYADQHRGNLPPYGGSAQVQRDTTPYYGGPPESRYKNPTNIQPSHQAVPSLPFYNGNGERPMFQNNQQHPPKYNNGPSLSGLPLGRNEGAQRSPRYDLQPDRQNTYPGYPRNGGSSSGAPNVPYGVGRPEYSPSPSGIVRPPYGYQPPSSNSNTPYPGYNYPQQPGRTPYRPPPISAPSVPGGPPNPYSPSSNSDRVYNPYGQKYIPQKIQNVGPTSRSDPRIPGPFNLGNSNNPNYNPGYRPNSPNFYYSPDGNTINPPPPSRGKLNPALSSPPYGPAPRAHPSQQPPSGSGFQGRPSVSRDKRNFRFGNPNNDNVYLSGPPPNSQQNTEKYPSPGPRGFDSHSSPSFSQPNSNPNFKPNSSPFDYHPGGANPSLLVDIKPSNSFGNSGTPPERSPPSYITAQNPTSPGRIPGFRGAAPSTSRPNQYFGPGPVAPGGDQVGGQVSQQAPSYHTYPPYNNGPNSRGAGGVLRRRPNGNPGFNSGLSPRDGGGIYGGFNPGSVSRAGPVASKSRSPSSEAKDNDSPPDTSSSKYIPDELLDASPFSFEDPAGDFRYDSDKSSLQDPPKSSPYDSDIVGRRLVWKLAYLYYKSS